MRHKKRSVIQIKDKLPVVGCLLAMMAAIVHAMSGSNALLASFVSRFTTFAYKDTNFSIEERVEDLISRMTMSEKIGQLTQVPGAVNMTDNILNRTCGSFLFLMGEEAEAAIEMNRRTRLQIPLIIGVDAIHGHSFSKTATIFPTQLGFASSWDVDLIERIANITAFEMRYTGPTWTFSPVMCIARDLRWGRVGETFGEDPYLLGLFGAAMVKGLQGDSLSNNPDKVLACVKHFAGYSETIGGLDATPSEFSKRTLLSFFLPPFQRCIEAGAGSVMSAYQSIDGVPAVANKWLLNTVLRDSWDFKGFVVSDWNNVGHLVKSQQICDTMSQAIIKSLDAGNDMAMSTLYYHEYGLRSMLNSSLETETVDKAVKRILSIKFQMGLFEDERMPDIKKSRKRSGTEEHRNVALEAALKSLILLKNDGILPLKENSSKMKIALLGQNADDTERQLGDWTLFDRYSFPERYDRNRTVTVHDALKSRFKNLKYEPGCIIERFDKGSIESAKTILKDAEMAIIVVGDSFSYLGEFRSTATLELMGTQIEMIDTVAKLGVPFIIDIISSKPLVLPPSAEKASAIIQQFNPGMLGGEAFAKIIMGEENPRGRLTLSIPSHSGQTPSYYQRPRGEHGHGYTDLKKGTQYPFGYGLTYTTFNYLDADIDKGIYGIEDMIKVSVRIENAGKRKGTEIIQCYIHDNVTSATWVSHELKAFSIVTLEPGQDSTVEILIPAKECSIVNEFEQRVVEQGEFEVWIGSSSADIFFILPFRIIN